MPEGLRGASCAGSKRTEIFGLFLESRGSAL